MCLLEFFNPVLELPQNTHNDSISLLFKMREVTSLIVRFVKQNKYNSFIKIRYPTS